MFREHLERGGFMALTLMPLVVRDDDQRYGYELLQRFKGDRFKVVVCINKGSTNRPVDKAYVHVIDYHDDRSAYYESGAKRGMNKKKLPARLYFAPVYSAELIGRTEDGSPLLSEAIDIAKEFLAKNRINWEQKQASEGYLCCDLAVVAESDMVVYYHPALA